MRKDKLTPEFWRSELEKEIGNIHSYSVTELGAIKAALIFWQAQIDAEITQRDALTKGGKV